MADDKSIFDFVVDELVERQRLVRAELHNRFKKTRPFRTEAIDPKEQIYNYYRMTPEIETALRQTSGDESVDDYIMEMEELIRRQRNA